MKIFFEPEIIFIVSEKKVSEDVVSLLRLASSINDWALRVPEHTQR
jgi:hypothetical protein